MIGNLEYHEARSMLQRIVLYELYKSGGRNFCNKCGKEIRCWQQLSLDHVIPWRNKGKEEGLRLLKDIENIKPAHKQCNINEKVGVSGYRGVGLNGKKWQARLGHDNEKHYLGNWDTKDQAAMKRDLYAYKTYDGDVILNFKHLDSFYRKEINNNWEFLNDSEKVKELVCNQV